MYFFFLFMTGKYLKTRCKADKKFYITVILSGIIFASAMLLLKEYMYLNIAVAVLFVFSIFAVLYRFSMKVKD